MAAAAIKPWGRSAIIGETVSSLALGIGMRWRETIVQIVEKRPSPEWELQEYRRCVVSHNTVRLLKDLGMTEQLLMKELRPARRWRFVSNELEVMREGDQYPGTAPSEAVFHTTEGKLLRSMRREFLRFGGFIAWGTEAHDVAPLEDDEGLWELHRDYGTAHSLEAIVAAARHGPVIDVLYGLDEVAKVPTVDFDVSSGFSRTAPEPILALFKPDVDFVVALGKGYILHMFKPELQTDLVSWRITQPVNSNLEQELPRQESGDAGGDIRDHFHPALRRLMATSQKVVHDTVRLPARPSPLLPDARNARLTMIGDSLYPVDAFELRGDRALVGIEDATAFCRRMYSTRFHRGFAPSDMREHELDAIAKRAQLLQRDAHDVESFLEAMRELPAEAEAEPTRHVEDAAGG
eukprot:CAMPEP_0174844384 /NCGR_PEP_ID=MMETSP1114-20130205/11064_1 /TAXON_ID=312471 /ORGANISM="Neobodo designis, Strain CCAP 1951/1" /LENGTH=406 /DNA_ID=CAMNT_0016078621 /DNA_START=32 /DNA_END=1249 /DNA_ORIENTATION=+